METQVQSESSPEKNVNSTTRKRKRLGRMSEVKKKVTYLHMKLIMAASVL